MARHDKHIPTDASRQRVLDLATFGVPQERIASYMGICDETLRTHYRKEIDQAEVEPNMEVAKTLYHKAVVDGDVKAIIYWLSTRGRWRKADSIAEKETKSLVEQLIAKL